MNKFRIGDLIKYHSFYDGLEHYAVVQLIVWDQTKTPPVAKLYAEVSSWSQDINEAIALGLDSLKLGVKRSRCTFMSSDRCVLVKRLASCFYGRPLQ